MISHNLHHVIFPFTNYVKGVRRISSLCFGEHWGSPRSEGLNFETAYVVIRQRSEGNLYIWNERISSSLRHEVISVHIDISIV